MSSNLPCKPSTKPATKSKYNQSKQHKVVAFDDGEINNSNSNNSNSNNNSQNDLTEAQLETIIEMNSQELSNICLSQICPEVLQKQDSNRMERSDQSALDLGLSSGINNTVISIHLSPLCSTIKTLQSSNSSWKLKSPIESHHIQPFINFSLTHQLQFQNTYNKCFIFKKKKPTSMRLFNCLMFKKIPPLAIKIQILDISNQLKITQLSGKQEQYTYYHQQLKKILWKNNFVSFDEIQSINLFLQINNHEFGDLIEEYKSIQKEDDLTSCVLETTMQMTMDLRGRLVQLAKQKDHYNKIKVEEFIDRRLFNNLHMFNLYKKAYESSETQYQSHKERITKSLTISMQFQYLQIHQHLRQSQTGNPYRQAIDQLSKLSIVISPFQKLQIILNTYQIIRKCSGNAINSQEFNILPMIIFVVLNSKISYTYANIYLMEHFLEQIEWKEEKNLVSNLYVAAEYITNSWRNQ